MCKRCFFWAERICDWLAYTLFKCDLHNTLHNTLVYVVVKLFTFRDPCSAGFRSLGSNEHSATPERGEHEGGNFEWSQWQW